MNGERGLHPVNTAHLVMGLVFLGLCGVWLAVQGGQVSTEDVRWLLPLPFLFAGGAGLVAFTVARLRRPSPPVVPADEAREAAEAGIPEASAPEILPWDEPGTGDGN